MRNLSLLAAVSLVAILLAACEGGLIGMGGGKNAETSCLDPQGPAYCGWRITDYKIMRYQKRTPSANLMSPYKEKNTAKTHLRLRSKNTTGGSKGVSTVNFVIFWEDPEYFANFSSSPVDTLNTDKAGEPRVTMNRPMSQLQPILDMLRNEKPAWLRAYRHPDNSAVATETQFFTSYEPVGENE
jgi:hypothetical protein